MDFKRRGLHLLIAIDQLAWVVISLGYGYPDETISSASWRYERKGKWIAKIARPVIDTLFFWDENHCEMSYRSEMLRTQSPKHIDIYDARKEVRKNFS